MKKIGKIIVFSLIVLGGVELLSSYFLYRYYSADAKALLPSGSAAVAVVDRMLIRIRGRKRVVQMSVDHGPLFHSDPVLGFAIYPGTFQVTERFDNQSQRFHLGIDRQSNRVTGYALEHPIRRIIFAGDSIIFGWGVDDEFTFPWLLQTRLPNYDVVNASLTSYSTIQTLLRLRQMEPKVNSEDIVVLAYHPMTNQFNVATNDTLHSMDIGYEFQLGVPSDMARMEIPFGALDSDGALNIRRVPFTCLRDVTVSVECRRDVSDATAVKVTELAFDEIFALHAGHVVVLFTNGDDSDPVIAHLRASGAAIVDVRPSPGDPEANDAMPIDSHGGPPWHHWMYAKLLAGLQHEHLVD